jgi:hypothetical protein
MHMFTNRTQLKLSKTKDLVRTNLTSQGEDLV